MIVTFNGHKDTIMSDELRQEATMVIEDAIKEGADTFYCGGYGNFDSACARIIQDLHLKYPHIKSYLVTPYMNSVRQKTLKFIEKQHIYDGFIYPELENVPLKFAISKRNEWMVEQADVVIAYVDHDWGGAWTTLQYAKRKKKRIINLAK